MPVSEGRALLLQELVRCAPKGREDKNHSGVRGRAWGREASQGSPRGEDREGSRWQRGAVDGAADSPSLQPISTIPLLRPTTRT